MWGPVYTRQPHRSRGPGRTILLDLCARAISHCASDGPTEVFNPPSLLFITSFTTVSPHSYEYKHTHQPNIILNYFIVI